MDSGAHLTVPGLRIVPVTEMRLQPSDVEGLLTVDGETIPFGPIHARVMPGQGRILVK